jgi:ATP-dependent Zn protease
MFIGGTAKTVLFWLVIVVSAYLLWQVVKANPANQNTPEISYSRFLAQVAEGQVTRVTIAGSVVRGYDSKGGSFRVIAPQNQSAMLDAFSGSVNRPNRVGRPGSSTSLPWFCWPLCGFS